MSKSDAAICPSQQRFILIAHTHHLTSATHAYVKEQQLSLSIIHMNNEIQ